MVSEIENNCDLQPIVDSLLKKEQDYLDEIKLLKEQINCLQARLFSRKSEKSAVEDKQL